MILFPEIGQVKKKKKLSKPFSLEMRLASRLVIKLHLSKYHHHSITNRNKLNNSSLNNSLEITRAQTQHNTEMKDGVKIKEG